MTNLLPNDELPQPERIGERIWFILMDLLLFMTLVGPERHPEIWTMRTVAGIACILSSLYLLPTLPSAFKRLTWWLIAPSYPGIFGSDILTFLVLNWLQCIWYTVYPQPWFDEWIPFRTFWIVGGCCVITFICGIQAGVRSVS
jgi:hypothetical protein